MAGILPGCVRQSRVSRFYPRASLGTKNTTLARTITVRNPRFCSAQTHGVSDYVVYPCHYNPCLKNCTGSIPLVSLAKIDWEVSLSGIFPPRSHNNDAIRSVRKPFTNSWSRFSGVGCDNLPIPDSDFETFYKPGTSETVTGTFVSGWTNGLGSNVQIACCGSDAVNWLDSTQGATGDSIEIPNWVTVSGNTGIQSGVGAGSSVGVYVNGSGYGGSGGKVASTSNLGTIQAGATYTLSISASDVNGSGSAALPVYLDLLDPSSNALPSSSSVFPTVSSSFQTFSKTYSATDLAPFVGDPLVIEFGAGSSGNQTDFDNVSLTMAIPEPPSSVAIVGLCGMGLVGFRVVPPAQSLIGSPVQLLSTGTSGPLGVLRGARGRLKPLSSGPRGSGRLPSRVSLKPLSCAGPSLYGFTD